MKTDPPKNRDKNQNSWNQSFQDMLHDGWTNKTMTDKIARYENVVRPPPGMEEINVTKNLEFHESFFDYIAMEPSTPGPGKISNDPTNGDMRHPSSKMRSSRYQVYNEWLDVPVFLPENILKFTNESTPVIVHLGSGVGDYFH